jgi:hypothetical protein
MGGGEILRFQWAGRAIAAGSGTRQPPAASQAGSSHARQGAAAAQPLAPCGGGARAAKDHGFFWLFQGYRPAAAAGRILRKSLPTEIQAGTQSTTIPNIQPYTFQNYKPLANANRGLARQSHYYLSMVPYHCSRESSAMELSCSHVELEHRELAVLLDV